MKLPKVIKRGDAYRITFMYKGQRYSCTRDSEKDCQLWAARKLIELQTNAEQLDPTLKRHFPVSKLFDLYYDEVGKTKKSAKYIKLKIQNFKINFPSLASASVHDITSEILSKQFKDIRVKQVQSSTLLREISLYSAIFTYAVNELFLLKDNPFFNMSKPPQPANRDRRISDSEIDRILAAAQYERGKICASYDHYVVWAFLFAIETTMRQGEIRGIKKSDVFDDFIRLPKTKNGAKRDVPLTKAAKDMLAWLQHDDEYLIPFRSKDSFSTAWERVVKKAKIDDLTFHDSRHEGITRMVHLRKLPVEILAKITGHKRIDILVNTYYNPTASEIAKMLSD